MIKTVRAISGLIPLVAVPEMLGMNSVGLLLAPGSLGREHVRSIIPYPVAVQMPCGVPRIFLTAQDVPLESLPCPCGQPGHWLVKYLDG